MGFGKKLKKAIKKVVKYSNPIQGIKDISDTLANQGEKLVSHLDGSRAAEKANEAALKSWQMQNEYNTPANQMQRLLDAGLNPNLAYGSVTTGNASSGPNLTSNDSTGTLLGNLGSVLGTTFDAVKMFQGIQNNKMAQAAQLSQAQHQQDVFDFQKEQALIANDLRQQELDLRRDDIAYRRSKDKSEYERWRDEFDYRKEQGRQDQENFGRRMDETERHNREMETRVSGEIGSAWNVLQKVWTPIVGALTGKPVTDIDTEAARVEKRLARDVSNFRYVSSQKWKYR